MKRKPTVETALKSQLATSGLSCETVPAEVSGVGTSQDEGGLVVGLGIQEQRTPEGQVPTSSGKDRWADICKEAIGMDSSALYRETSLSPTASLVYGHACGHAAVTEP